VGLVFSGKALQFKGERLNPITGIGRMFSARSAVELLKSIAKIIIVGYIVFSFLGIDIRTYKALLVETILALVR